MSRISMPTVAMLVALASTPAWSQSLTPASEPVPPVAASPAASSPPSVVPVTPAQRVRAATPVPAQGPAPTAQAARVPAPAVQPAPRVAPMPVRDAQGRIVPGARDTTPGRARDPATAQEFRTAPSTRPH